VGKFWSLLFLLVPVLGVYCFIYGYQQGIWLPEDVSSHGHAIDHLFFFITGLTGIVFVATEVALFLFMWKYDHKVNFNPVKFTHGSHSLEVVWTIIPAIVLLVIFIPTVSIMYDHADDADDGDYVIEVYGKQWWWEVHYPYMGQEGPDGERTSLVTANEVFVPVGQDIQIKLYSNNVIHSFYVPQLIGKMDVMPGHENRISFTVPQPGRYFGECAEFCGDSHAWMRFQVIAVEQAEFDAWVDAQNSAPASAAAEYGTDDQGLVTYPQEFGLCIACHRVNGTPAQFSPVGLVQEPGTPEEPGSARTSGPNLGLFACRSTIGAGILPNTLEDLKAWLRDPGAIKPGNYMASVIQPGTLTEEAIDAIANFLFSLEPEGGCDSLLPGEGTENYDAAQIGLGD